MMEDPCKTETNFNELGSNKEENQQSQTDEEVDHEGCETSQTHIFDLLAEIWDYIIPKLSPTEFHTIINTCPAWRKMFQSQRTTRLLPLVLPILANHSSITNNSLLRWREVCKETKSVIDSILEHYVSPQKYYESLSTLDTEWSPYVIDESQPVRVIIPRLRLRYNFYDARKIDEFMTHLKTSSKLEYSSPFVTKSLLIPIVNLGPGNPNNFNVVSLNMLSKFGHGVTDITLHALGMNVPCFFSLLSQLPNVKRIGIMGRGGQWSEDMQQEIESWERNLELEHFEFLDVEGFGDYLTEANPRAGIFAALLRRCGSQLKRLTCSTANAAGLQPELVPNLSFLRISLFDRSTFTILSQLQSLQLEELQLRSVAPSDFTLPEVFQAASIFAESLTHLRLFLSLKVEQDAVFENSDTASLPKLTKLSTSLHNVQESWFWSFVNINCPNLNHLNLYNGTTYELNSHEITQDEIDALKRGLQIVPHLEKITVSCGLNSRGQTPERVVIIRNGGQQRIRFERMAWL